MAKSKFLTPGSAAGAAILAAVFGVLVLSSEPTPRAQAETTQRPELRAEAGAPEGLRGRSSDVASRIRVIDGDTVEDISEDITYRLENIDAPETGSRARCDAERALGERATEAARSLVAHARRLDLRPTARVDRYGRTIARVLIDGRDMGDALIAEGLARPWRGRREPWCDGNGALIP